MYSCSSIMYRDHPSSFFHTYMYILVYTHTRWMPGFDGQTQWPGQEKKHFKRSFITWPAYTPPPRSVCSSSKSHSERKSGERGASKMEKVKQWRVNTGLFTWTIESERSGVCVLPPEALIPDTEACPDSLLHAGIRSVATFRSNQ